MKPGHPPTETDVDAVRRAGHPTIYLVVAVVFVLCGVGFVALGLKQLANPLLPVLNGGIGIVVGPLQVVVGVIYLMQWRRHRVRYSEYRRITCKSCGYDRRGLPADAKCPECGTVPGPAA